MNRTDQQPPAIRIASGLLNRELKLVKILTAGQHALTSLAAETGDSAESAGEYIVREFPAGDPAALEESEILHRIRGLGDLVPRLIAVSEDPQRPVIVTSVVPGSTPDPDIPLETIAAEMAAALIRIHDLHGTGLPAAPAAPPSGRTQIAVRARQEWSALDRGELVLSHSDFWAGNAMWDGGRLTGVVDWSGACLSSRGFDLAWCRQDLALLGSTDAAQFFLDEYERLLGRPIPDIRAWDVQAAARAEPVVETWLPNYVGIGLTSMTAELLRKRLDAWIASL